VTRRRQSDHSVNDRCRDSTMCASRRLGFSSGTFLYDATYFLIHWVEVPTLGGD